MTTSTIDRSEISRTSHMNETPQQIGLASIIIPNYRLSGWHIWPLFVIYAVLFEWYLPQTSHVYTSDPIDLLAYLGGILVFQKWVNQVPQ